MATVEEAVAAVVAAADELEAATTAPVAAPAEDPLRKVVEDQLLSEGWAAPAPAATEEPEETPTPSE